MQLIRSESIFIYKPTTDVLSSICTRIVIGILISITILSFIVITIFDLSIFGILYNFTLNYFFVSFFLIGWLISLILYFLIVFFVFNARVNLTHAQTSQNDLLLKEKNIEKYEIGDWNFNSVSFTLIFTTASFLLIPSFFVKMSLLVIFLLFSLRQLRYYYIS